MRSFSAVPFKLASVEQGEHDLHLRDSGVLDIHIDLGDSDQCKSDPAVPPLLRHFAAIVSSPCGGETAGR